MDQLTNPVLVFAFSSFVFWLIRQGLCRLVERIGHERSIEFSRTTQVKNVVSIVVVLAWLSITFVFLGVDYSHFALFFSSAFAVIGVAFFAQWSILSNVTASVVVYFFFPYQLGDTVKVIDGENTIEGEIVEITLFHVLLKNAQGNLVGYPNSLVFQKAVEIINKKAK